MKMDKSVSVSDKFIIRQMQDYDYLQVRDIYIQGVNTRNATFETIVPDSFEEWNKKYIPVCRFVAVTDVVLGWTALNQLSIRSIYAGVVEVSIYVASSVQRLGIGYALLSSLVKASEENNFWMLQAGIFPENTASLALHKKCGFREVGIREKIAKLDGRWRDMLLLERRSDKFID